MMVTVKPQCRVEILFTFTGAEAAKQSRNAKTLKTATCKFAQFTRALSL